MTKTEVFQEVEQFFDGVPRDDLLNLHSFLKSEDDEFTGHRITAEWQYPDIPNEYDDPDALHICCTVRDSFEWWSFDFTDPDDRQEIDHVIHAIETLLDEGYQL
jgi:hypothetical protein